MIKDSLWESQSHGKLFWLPLVLDIVPVASLIVALVMYETLDIIIFMCLLAVAVVCSFFVIIVSQKLRWSNPQFIFAFTESLHNVQARSIFKNLRRENDLKRPKRRTFLDKTRKWSMI